MRKILFCLTCFFSIVSISCKNKDTSSRKDLSNKVQVTNTPVKRNENQILEADYEKLTKAIATNAKNVDSILKEFVKNYKGVLTKPYKASKKMNEDYAYSVGYANVYTYKPDRYVHYSTTKNKAAKQLLFDASAILSIRGNVIHIKVPVSYLNTKGKWKIVSSSSSTNRVTLIGPAAGSILKGSDITIVNMFYRSEKDTVVSGNFMGGGVELRISSRDSSGHLSITPNTTGEQINAISYFDKGHKLLSSRANCTSIYDHQGVFLFRRHPDTKRSSIIYALKVSNTGLQTNY